MESQDLQTAQQNLSKKRQALCLPILPEPIFLTEETGNICEQCGGIMTKTIFLGMENVHCKPCFDKADELEKLRIQERKANVAAYREREKARKQMEKLNIGHRYIGLTFDDYKPVNEKAKLVKNECIEYTDSFTRNSGANMLFIGSPGTGKNMIAAIIGQELFKNGISSLHTTAMKLVRSIKDTWRNNNASEQDAINAFISPDLLVIDEIGVQFGSSTEQLFLTEVINDRYNLRRPTILISNLKLSQLTEIMGERVIDRFYDDGSKFLVFDWQSHRRINK